MSRTSQGMKSLSSTGRFISGCDQSVVGLSIVGMEFTLAGCLQLFLKPRRLGVEILFFHPAQEGLSGNFTGVGIPSCELLLNERLDRFRHRYFHAFKLHKRRAKTIRNSTGRDSRRTLTSRNHAGCSDAMTVSQPQNPIAETLPLSLLNDFLYCARRAALKIVEGWRSEN